MGRQRSQNQALVQYLQSGGTELPATAELSGHWVNGQGGAKFTPYACAFCSGVLKPNLACSILHYRRSSTYSDPSVNPYRTSPYLMCSSCYSSGARRLEKMRSDLEVAKTTTKIVYSHNDVMTQRLSTYLDSLGVDLPPDYENYRKRGPLAETCLFCSSSPAEYPVKRRLEEDISVAVDTGTYCCSECNEHVEEMVEGIVNGELFSKSGSYDPGASHRIQLYCYKGELMEGINTHYQHLPDMNDDHSTAPIFGIMKDHCYFCRNQCADDYVMLQAPVENSDVFTGGHFKACKVCYAKVITIFKTDNTSVDLDKWYRDEHCPKCKAQYIITNPEWSDRRISKTDGTHLCPTCTHEVNYEMVLENEFSPPGNNRFSRYSVLNCSYCNGVLYVDLTVDRKVLRTNLISKETRIICQTCNNKGEFPIFVGHLAFSIYRVYKLGGKDRYSVVIESNSGTSSFVFNGDAEEIPHVVRNSYDG